MNTLQPRQLTGGVVVTEFNEGDLVRRARAGEPAAFMSLLDAYDKAFRAVAYAIAQDRGAMDDILQDSFLKGFRAIRRLKEGTSFKSWMCRVIHNTAIDHRRRSRMIYDSEMVTDRPNSGRSTAETVETVSVVTAALAKLSPEQRTIVRLIDGEQFRYDDVAAMLSIPAGTVASRARAARIRLRSLLTEVEGMK